jgi:hypothetical protein
MKRSSVLIGVLALLLIAGFTTHAEAILAGLLEIENSVGTAAPGEWIEWKYRITNVGDEDLSLTGTYYDDPSVIASVVVVTGIPPSLAPGASFPAQGYLVHSRWQVDSNASPGTYSGFLGFTAPYPLIILREPVTVNVVEGPGNGNSVTIDIKPCSDPNSINLKSKGVVPVAVLTTDVFDATSVDPSTVRFAGASPIRWAMEDVCPGDGDVDMVFHFKTQGLGLDAGAETATLTGQTTGGASIEGMDTVNIVPKGKAKGHAAKPAAPLAEPSTWGQVKSKFGE